MTLLERGVHPRKACTLVLVAVALLGCETPEAGYEPAEREYRAFEQAYPVLMRDCGFHACHGAPERLYRIYGPGRARLDPEVRAFGTQTGAEASLSYQLALSMIDARNPERSLLLRKPLAVAAGGSPHGGVDRFGRNVYRSKQDPGYQALERFVLELTE
jgi:hypothetical protein